VFIVESIAKIRRMYHVDGKAIKLIAKELNISKNTVRKVIRSDATKFELAKYTKAKPVLGKHLAILNQLLLENIKEPVRRRMTAKKLYEQLKMSGYQGSYESVNLIVRRFRRDHEAKGRQVFIPLIFAPGEAFQFDWGEEEICLNGEITRVKAARIKLCYSRYSLVIVYPNEQLEMVMDAHGEAFKFFAGCCIHGIYDNMKTAVKKILNGKDRIFNEKFAQMASHYLFAPIACSPASGWEKGQVEKQVGDSRRNFFTPILKGDSYEAINCQLREMSIEWAKNKRHPEFTEKTILEIYEEEKAYLIGYRGQFTSYRLHPTVVSPLSLIGYDTNMYSVPCEYVGLSVSIKSYAWQIVILHESKIIAEYVRCFKRYQKIYNPWHYITALERKPGALRNGAPFKELMSLLPEVFSKIRSKLEGYKDGDKQFIDILLLVDKHGLEKVTNACNLTIAAGGCSFKLVEQYLLQPETKTDLQELAFIQLKNPPSADCTIYSKLHLTTEGS
jgi:transposase